jgi:hypothetical protein
MKALAICVALAGGCLLLVGSGHAVAQNEQLTVTQDESSMERVIEAYLKAKHNLVINEKFIKPDDLWLELPFDGNPMPKYRYAIDTQPLNKTDDGKVTERGVRIQLFTGITVPEAKRPALLGVINDFNRGKVFSATYLDTDGEIVLDWTLNVMAPGLATEYVFDVLAREDKLWRELWPLASAALK